jgi:hypothetical protein
VPALTFSANSGRVALIALEPRHAWRGGLLHGGCQELPLDQGLRRVAERVLGVNRLCEPSLAQLDGAHEDPRSFRGAIGEREVRVLVPLANQLLQVPRAKIVLRDYLAPDIRVFLEVGCHARWHVRPGFDTEGFSQGRPHIAPLEHVAVSDVERFVRRLRRLRTPDHHVRDEVCIGGFPNERRAARKTEPVLCPAIAMSLLCQGAGRGVDSCGRRFSRRDPWRSRLRPGMHQAAQALKAVA